MKPWKIRWRAAPKLRVGDPPAGVRIVVEDGRVYPCDVLRDPDGDKDRMAMWVAVPREPVPPLPDGSWHLDGVLPPRSMLGVRLEVIVPLPVEGSGTADLN